MKIWCYIKKKGVVFSLICSLLIIRYLLYSFISVDPYSENEYAYIDRHKLASFAQAANRSKVGGGADLGPDLAPYASTDILRSQINGSIYNNKYCVSIFVF